MTERRSRSARSAALLLLVALSLPACVAGLFRSPEKPRTRYLLENPPASADLVGRLSFRETKTEDTLIDLAHQVPAQYFL